MNRFLSILFLWAAFALAANAQTDFRYAYGGRGNDVARTGTAFGRKFFYLLGSSLSNSASKKLTLVKTDSLGRLLQIKDYSAGSTNEGYGILVKGNYLYWCGEVNNGGREYVSLVKSDLDGSILWQKFYRKQVNDGRVLQPFSLAATTDGGFAIVGLDYPDRFFMLKTDSLGVLQWNKTRNDISQGYCVNIARNGDMLVSGMYNSDIIVSRMKNDGTVLWSTFLGADGLDVGKSVAEMNDGNLLINGYRYAGSRDFELTKISADGRLMWSRSYNWKEDVNYGITLDTDGNPIVTGYTFSSTPNDIDYSIFKLDTSGTILWSKLLSGPFPDYVVIGPHHLTPLGRNEYVTVGISQSADNGAAGDDFVLFRFHAETDLGCFNSNYPLTRSNLSLSNVGTPPAFLSAPVFEQSTAISFTARNVALCRKIACEANASVYDSLGADFSIPCNDTGSYVLNAGNPGFQYQWSTGDTVQQIRVHGAGLYQVRVTGPCGSFIDSIRISQSVTPRPQIRALGPTTFCQGDSVILTYIGTVQNPRWSNGDTLQQIVVRSGGPYWLIAGSGACPSRPSDTIRVTINPNPEAIAGEDAVVCPGQSRELGVPTDFTPYTFTWRPIQYLSSTTLSNPTVTNSLHDTSVTVNYIVRWLNPFTGCQDFDTVKVILAKPASEIAGPDIELCSGETGTLGTQQVIIPESFFQWMPVRWLSEPNQGLTSITPILDTGAVPRKFTYTLTYSAMGGCPVIDSAVVTVHPKFEMRPDGYPLCTDSLFVIPNVITPNADGLNDYFKIPTLAYYPDNQLKIYNRWGKLMYSASPYNNGWQGNLTPGIYFYRLELPTAKRKYQGWVEVVK